MSWFPVLASAAVLYPLFAVCMLRRRPLSRTIHPALPALRVRSSAHRGGAAERPENSLAAFAHATSVGMDLLELDVHLTKDGKVVVYHDHTVDRVSEDGVSGKVSSYNYADLPRIRRRPRLPPPFHSPSSVLGWSVEAAAPAAEAEAYVPPLLEEVFRRFPDRSINIDLKDGGQPLVAKVAALIHQYQRQDRTIWGCAKDEESVRMHADHPSIPLFFSSKQVGLLFLKYVTGVLPFCYLKERALEIPLFTPQLQQRMKENGALFAAVGWRGSVLRAIVAGYTWASTSPTLLKHLQARNIKVVYWVLNTPEEFAFAYDLGPDGIMTDYPSHLAAFLQQRKEQKLPPFDRDSIGRQTDKKSS